MNDAWGSKNKEYSSRHYNEKNNFSRNHAKKMKWKRAIHVVGEDLQHYAKNTTLHGFRYLSSDEVNLGGKFIWLVVCLVSFSLSIYLMFTVWEKYAITPTVISVDSTTHPIWGLRFPAVTICNYNKIYKPRAEVIAEQLKSNSVGLNDTEINEYFDALPKLIREENLLQDFDHTVQRISRVMDSTEWLMYRLMQPCDKLLLRCSWLGTKHDCTKIFKTVKTAEGFCCAFNYHVIGGEFPNDGENFHAEERDKSNTSTLPGVREVQMVPGAGRDTGLEVFIDVETDTIRGSIRPYAGASILIHDPFIYPEINIRTVIVQPAQEISVIVRGNVIESEDNVRELSQKRRKCWFEDEILLNTTEEYSYQACVTECRMEHLMSRCRCLPFYYPKTFDGVRRCGVRDIQCLRAFRGILSKLQTPYDKEKFNGSTPKPNVPKCLQCLPECSSNDYTVETESAILNDEQSVDLKSSLATHPLRSVVTVFFPDITCLKYRRASFMTWDNLLASFGGIFGLCIGGSVVSFVEMIYYLIIWLFRRAKTVPTSKPLLVHSHGANERLERQPIPLTRKIPIKNWMSAADLEGAWDNNRNARNGTRPMNFPHGRTDGTTFTIEFSDTKTELPSNFIKS